MATAYITEFGEFGANNARDVDLAMEPALAHQTVSFTTANASTAFDEKTVLIRILVDANCYMVFGDTPVATASHERVLADTDEWRGVKPGQKVSFYDGTS